MSDSYYMKAAKKLREALDKAGAFLTDVQALEVQIIYAVWRADATYAVGDRVMYEGVLYKCLTAHTAQETWTPTDSPALWAKVLTDDTGKILPWEQPTSTNPYMKGDKVSHNDKNWISTVDNNVWEPGAYGWEEITA